MSDFEWDRDLFLRYMLLAVAVLEGARKIAKRSYPHLVPALSDMESDCEGFIGEARGVRVIDIVDGRVVALSWVQQ